MNAKKQELIKVKNLLAHYITIEGIEYTLMSKL